MRNWFHLKGCVFFLCRYQDWKALAIFFTPALFSPYSSFFGLLIDIHVIPSSTDIRKASIIRWPSKLHPQTRKVVPHYYAEQLFDKMCCLYF